MVWLLVLLGLLGADPDESRVRALVERLGSESFAERQTAQARLAAYGESIVPVLQRIKTADPEIRRIVRGLTRTSRRLRVTV
ncbi:MAG: hypothetical protein OER88_12615, partial [Planctomycetota bacterium]|nr:hypothetical protein [Planctomycetota bacterium]